jgi:Derlin-2/3
MICILMWYRYVVENTCWPINRSEVSSTSKPIQSIIYQGYRCILLMAEVQGQGQDLFGWYHEIPLISRLYLTSILVVTTACYMDYVSPLTLYYNYDLILNRGQYWRIFTSFLFFGTFSIDFLFHMYFVVRYCRLLEEGSFRGRTADFFFMFIYGAVMMIVVSMSVSYFSKIKFLGHPLTFMMVYLWARDPENYHTHMSFFGVITFSAPYLPWVLLLFSLVLGNPVEMDLMGILVGHTYYFMDSVYPKVAAVRGWSWKRLLVTPSFLHYIFATDFGFQVIDDTEEVMLI